MYANGNNVGCTADMTRRVLYCNMDAEVENPEFRQVRERSGQDGPGGPMEIHRRRR